MTWKLMKYLWTRLVMTINSVICSSCAEQHYGTHIKRSNHQPFWLVTHSHSWFSIKCLWLNKRNLHPLTSKSMCMADIRKSIKTWSLTHRQKTKLLPINMKKWRYSVERNIHDRLNRVPTIHKNPVVLFANQQMKKKMVGKTLSPVFWGCFLCAISGYN